VLGTNWNPRGNEVKALDRALDAPGAADSAQPIRVKTRPAATREIARLIFKNLQVWPA
jgi:hypothetical protein